MGVAQHWECMRMHLNPEDKSRLGDGVTVVKEPPGPDRPALPQGGRRERERLSR